MTINNLIKSLHEFSRFVLAKEFLSLVVETRDRNICTQLRTKEPGRYENRGYQDRQLKTSMGIAKLRFTKLRDTQTGATSCPGKKVLDCPAYVQWTSPLLVDAVSMLPFMSYKHSVEETIEQHGFSPSKTTLHNRLEDLVGTGEYRPYLRKRRFENRLSGDLTIFQRRLLNTAIKKLQYI